MITKSKAAVKKPKRKADPLDSPQWISESTVGAAKTSVQPSDSPSAT